MFYVLCIKKRVMKKIVVLVAIITMLAGCKSNDNDIKKAIAAEAREELMFAGVRYTVSKAVVTLSGTCPSEELRARVEKRVKSSPGVKRTINNIAVAPVSLDNDFLLKQKMDSVLAGYASVQGEVKNNTVWLEGSIKHREMDKLLKSLSALPLSGIANNLVVE
jgi:hypothetical protein